MITKRWPRDRRYLTGPARTLVSSRKAPIFTYSAKAAGLARVRRRG
jgi:hypothetical protein